VSEHDDRLGAAYEMRRRILGDAYVDAQRGSQDDRVREFQDYVTGVAWGVWTRPTLSPRDRSMLVLGMTGALGRMEEFRLHASSSPQTGLTDDELGEIVFQIAAYCGAPAGVAAMRELRYVRQARENGTDV
jgi:4-carboxymuconolactone decarboxylase